MLYVCPTPIGNLEDITLRVLRILKEVDCIAAEDTRHTRRLLNHFQIKNRLTSLHEHNERDKLEEIISFLKEGSTAALVSDAGMPGISDPGALLIRAAIEEGIPVTVLPGANAAITAYVQSGLAQDHFLFYGFLPRKGKARIDALKSLKDLPCPVIFYEAPHRLCITLQDLIENLGNRQAAVSRELTKRFEETLRGSLKEILDHFQTHAPRGEFVITVAGGEGRQEGQIEEDDIRRALNERLEQGLSRKTAVQEVSQEYRLPKNRVYEIALDSKSKT